MDLVSDCDRGGDTEEDTLRTKLVRNRNTAACCVSEAIAHRIFEIIGIRVADAFGVGVGRDLAAALTAQFGFDDAVKVGLHWGTSLIRIANEVRLERDDYAHLAHPEHVFLIYLVDALMAYGDRQTHGNVLLVMATDNGKRDIIPIDQSHCFGGPDTLRSAEALNRIRRESRATAFAGMEQLLLASGPFFVDEAAERVLSRRSEILEAVEWPPDEWYGISGIDPSDVAEFLEFRLDNFATLAMLAHWKDLQRFSGPDWDRYVL